MCCATPSITTTTRTITYPDGRTATVRGYRCSSCGAAWED